MQCMVKEFVCLKGHLRINEPDDYKNYLRMNAVTFDELLLLLAPYLHEEDTRMRNSRLVASLHYLATGRSYKCLKFNSGISPQSLGTMIPETCRHIRMAIGECFEISWQFPNCKGALDGKHIRIRCPKLSGAQYYSCKHFLQYCFVGDDYVLLYVNVCTNKHNRWWRMGIYTTLYEDSLTYKLNVPQEDWNTEKLNLVFVTNEAFSLHKHLLKPFSQFELRARNVIENVFGIMSSRFRVFHSAIHVNPENTR
ncbi:hypothetical protein PR048_001935 [Dryococelus australis]|uniref:DDE Tnp4 domain-containing protein n=1 Tax=Dryococelus australis TaxID=614101 RepID=A0ABQ9IIY0_9NEOP|nr:hypothetical protein PR048_001935 [Dryococelus australis]